MKFLKLFTLLAIASLFMTSCGDEEPEEKVNEMIFDGEKIALTNGVYESYGPNGNGSHDWDVTLFGAGIEVDGDGVVSGAGAFLYLDLNTDSTTGLVNGTYSYTTNDTRMVFDLTAGTVGEDYELEGVEINGGTVEITSQSSNTVNLSFNLTDISGNSTTGQYNGPITLVQ